MKTEISQYDQQALDFLTKTGTQFKTEYLRHGKHFVNDKETRDVYKITLTRGTRSYNFEFGQSIACSGQIQLAKHLRNKMIAEPLIKQFGSNYAFNLKDKQTIRFTTSLTDKDLQINPNYSAPTEYDVLACLTKYDPGTFADFCSAFGYDENSKSAEKTYNGVVDEWKNVCMLFSDDEIQELAEIQ